MAPLLAWYNLIFYLPLAVGLLLVVGAAAGVGDGGEGPHLDADHAGPDHADADHGSGEGFSLAELLGFGRVPMAIVLTTLCVTFGGAGVVTNFLLAPLLAVSPLFVGISCAVALVTMVLGTSLITRLVGRYLPTLETNSLRAGGLVGSMGTLLLDADATGGLVLVRKDGDVYQVQCTAPEPLPKGSSVLLTDFDENTRMYAVCRDPLNE